MESVTVVHPSIDFDDYGNPTLDYAGGTEVDVAGCLLNWTGTKESAEGQIPRQTATLYAPSGTVVTSVDRVLVRGDEWEVVGLPHDWRGYGPSGLEIYLERTPTAGDVEPGS
jgi:hypothetical protein